MYMEKIPTGDDVQIGRIARGTSGEGVQLHSLWTIPMDNPYG